MKALRALLLVLALAVCAFAGDQTNGGTNGEMGGGGRSGDILIGGGKDGERTGGKTGDMPLGGKTGALDPVTAITLQLLQSVLPLL